MKLIPWLVILSLGLVGCSGSKSAQKVNEETPQIELSDADEFIENPNEEPVAEAASEVATEESMAQANPDGAAMEEPVVADTPAEDPSVAMASESTEEVAAASPTIENDSIGGAEKIYKVQKNETLMLIAFKIYGDYEKWKELASQNRDALKGSTALRAGMSLKYVAPAEEFVWNPEGLPYLIRTGDTLGTISGSVYGTIKKWKLIWNNNRPLIRDPNRIFAGFTIYYLENGREVAAEL